MPETLAVDALCKEGAVALEKGLGPVQALRFLAMISRQSFDYQTWREQQFAGLSLGEILSGAQAHRDVK